MSKTNEPRRTPPAGMTRRAVIVGAVLASASGIAVAREPKVAAPVIAEKQFEKWVPKSFGNWSVTARSGVLLPPPDTLRDRLYDNLVTRVYQSPDLPPIMLLLAYNNAQNGVVQVHRPEVCYPVGGFDLTPTEPIEMTIATRNVPANFFTATGPNRVEQVAYFTRMGAAFPRSWAEQRMSVMRANLTGVIPDGMMMRVSMLGTSRATALPILDSFAAQFVNASAPKLQQLLVGRAA